jgi:hypothetical protein
MIEPHLDEPFAHGERDEPLRRLPGHAKLLGNLLLIVAGDVVQPPGARGIVEPSCRCLLPECHQKSPRIDWGEYSTSELLPASELCG